MTQEELNKLKEITNEEARLEFINDCYRKNVKNNMNYWL